MPPASTDEPMETLPRVLRIAFACDLRGIESIEEWRIVATRHGWDR